MTTTQTCTYGATIITPSPSLKDELYQARVDNASNIIQQGTNQNQEFGGVEKTQPPAGRRPSKQTKRVRLSERPYDVSLKKKSRTSFLNDTKETKSRQSLCQAHRLGIHEGTVQRKLPANLERLKTIPLPKLKKILASLSSSASASASAASSSLSSSSTASSFRWQSKTWISPLELYISQRECTEIISRMDQGTVMADDDTTALERFAGVEARRHRKAIRRQLREVVFAVQDFQTATGVYVPDVMATICL